MTPRIFPTPRRVRVLVIDDSLVFRRFLVRTLQADPQIDVIGDLGSADAAEQFLRDQRPDVITLDLEMPGKSGLDFLRETARPMAIPTIVISSTTPRGAKRTIEALEAGAIDVIPKPRGVTPGTPDHLALDAIASRARAVANVRLGPQTAAPQSAPRSVPPSALPSAPRPATAAAARFAGAAPAQALAQDWVLLLGASTGGVQALTTVLQAMPRDCPPILIVQHMPEGFTGAFAQRLDTICDIAVKEAEAGDPLRMGQALIAPGGTRHMALARMGTGRLSVDLVAGDPVCFSRPAVDVLFFSAARVAGARVSAAVLTGMGSDGALGLLALRRAGAQTFAQDEETSLIYGMPARAWEAGGALEKVALGDVAACLIGSVGTRSAGQSQTQMTPRHGLSQTDRLAVSPKEF